MDNDQSLEEVQKVSIAGTGKRRRSQDSGISSKRQLGHSSRGTESDTQRQYSSKDATIKSKLYPNFLLIIL